MAVPLVQLTRAAPTQGASAGLPFPRPPSANPGGSRSRRPAGPTYVQLKGMMRELGLHTVCEEARCPNIGECWEHKAATFMILGDVCTRNCTYCAVAHGTPKAFDPLEPVRLAEAVERMGLAHVVITSVDRDDLPNGGAEAFAGCVTEIRRRLPDTTVEVLIPDFKGSERALAIVMDVAAGHPQPQPGDRRAAVPPGPPGGPLRPGAGAAGPRPPDGARRRSPSRGSSSAWARSGTSSWSACGTSAGAT